MHPRFAIVLVLACGSAMAADITVDVLGDPVPDGCTPGSCSLREAISLSNSLAGANRILLPATPGAPLQLALPGIETLNAGGDLNIHDEVEIIGAGVNATTLVQTVADRLFAIHMPAPGKVTIRALSMQGGSSAAGGAVSAGSLLVVSAAAAHVALARVELLRGNAAAAEERLSALIAWAQVAGVSAQGPRFRQAQAWQAIALAATGSCDAARDATRAAAAPRNDDAQTPHPFVAEALNYERFAVGCP